MQENAESRLNKFSHFSTVGVFICSLFRVCTIHLEKEVNGAISLAFWNPTRAFNVDFFCVSQPNHLSSCRSVAILNVERGDYTLKDDSLAEISLRVIAPDTNHRLFCRVGVSCELGPIRGYTLGASDRIQVSLICGRESSMAVTTFPNSGIATWRSGGFLGWDPGAVFSNVSVGIYRLCWSSFQDNEYVYNYDIGSLTVLGPVANQLFVCYDRTICEISDFLGFGLHSGDLIAILPITKNCSKDALSHADTSFPNRGISLPSLSGTSYTFGSTLVNVSTFPTFLRICWKSGIEDLVAPGGVLRIDSFETYYRKYIEPDPSWSPKEPGWKMWLLGVTFPLIFVAGYIYSLISKYFSRKFTEKLVLDRRSTASKRPAFLRMGASELDPFTEARLRAIETVDPKTIDSVIRIRRML